LRIGLNLLAEPTTITGTGIYAKSLISALAKIDSENEYVLFTHMDNLPAFQQEFSTNFRYLAYKFNARRDTIRLLAQQVLFRGRMGGSNLDLLHSFTNAAPLLYGGRQVLTLHDLAPMTTHQVMPSAAKRLLWSGLVRRSVARADRVIAISKHTRGDIVRLLGTPEGKITLIPNGVGGSFMPRKDCHPEKVLKGLSPQKGFILYVGRLTPGKDIGTLIAAYGLLPERVRQGFQLVLVGPDEGDRGRLEGLVKEKGLTNDVLFTGYVAHGKLPEVYPAARCAVLPSRYEGFGLPLVEAMACGTPVIACEVSSMPEVVGEGGLLFPPGDEKALSAAMESLCTDNGLHAEKSQAALKQASQFTWSECARKTLAVYREVIST